jgi:hypothetical protein
MVRVMAMLSPQFVEQSAVALALERVTARFQTTITEDIRAEAESAVRTLHKAGQRDVEALARYAASRVANTLLSRSHVQIG